MAARNPLFIGIDIGTSALKAVMSAPGGTMVDSFSKPHAMQRPEPGAAEQDPAVWWQHAQQALAQFAGHRRAGDVVAIGITSQVNTHVFCDASLRPLRPAITWQDTRPGPMAAKLAAAISEADKIAALGAPIPLDASHALARITWVEHTQGDIWQNTQHVLLPKDYVIAKLTSTVIADPIASIGLVGTDHTYAAPMLDLAPRARDVLAPLADPLTIVGTVSAGTPFAGTPVCCGTMDAWASMFGLGVAGESEAMYLSGTSDVLGLISKDGVGYPGIVTFAPWRGMRLHAAPTQSGGSSLAWLSHLLGQDVGALAALAEGVTITADSPLFLPHLEGERAPLWDPHARASFAGLSAADGPANLVASVMEGVAFSARWALEAVEKSGAHSIASLRHGGGGSRADAWCQIRANALGRTLDRVSSPQAGAIGACAMAAVACGELESLEEAAKALAISERAFVPDAQAHSISCERYGRFCQLYAQLKPIRPVADV